MIFNNGKIKITGCKNSDDNIYALKLLLFTIYGHDNFKFILCHSMINFIYKYENYLVNKVKLNKLFNNVTKWYYGYVGVMNL